MRASLIGSIAVRLFAAALFVAVQAARADGFPEPKQGDWVAKDFRFHDGERIAELKIHYRTIGTPGGEPVLVLHGTAGSGASMLAPEFAGVLFGRGEPLDAARYFIILPDAIGTGGSTKPSDGLRAHFPRYDYDDMVLAQYRRVTEGLGLRHLRLVIGNSMGGMQAWLWGERYPGFMDALVPMASQPVAMSGRNWMLRRMLVDSIRNDPQWQGGDYGAQPAGMQRHLVYFNLATIGGSQALYRLAPNAAKGDELVAKLLAQPFRGDANDVLYQWESSFDYDPSTGIDRIRAALLAINSSDDERNPPELGVMEPAIARIPQARYRLIPGGPQTRGHGTTMLAQLYAQDLAELLRSAPRP